MTAPGIMVLALIYTIGETSGAHLNPAVTIAFAARGHFPWQRVPGYVVAQLCGAMLAAGLLRALFGSADRACAGAPPASPPTPFRRPASTAQPGEPASCGAVT